MIIFLLSPSTRMEIIPRSSRRTCSNSKISFASQKVSLPISRMSVIFSFTFGTFAFFSSRAAMFCSCFFADRKEGICSMWERISPYIKLSNRFAYSSGSCERTIGAIFPINSPLSPSPMHSSASGFWNFSTNCRCNRTSISSGLSVQICSRQVSTKVSRHS